MDPTEISSHLQPLSFSGAVKRLIIDACFLMPRKQLSSPWRNAFIGFRTIDEDFLDEYLGSKLSCFLNHASQLE